MRGYVHAAAILSRQLQRETRCATCGLSTIVLNQAAAFGMHGTRMEPVTLETHCSCAPDRPAYQLRIDAEEFTQALSTANDSGEGDITQWIP